MHGPISLNRASELGPIELPWWQDWRGECVAIVASGPSAKKANISALRDRIHVIAINESYKLCPWAEILYGCDVGWWRLRAGVPDFHGLKISQDAVACKQYRDLVKIDVVARSDELVLDRPGRLGAGGNSGFQTLNLAVQFGATGIMLIGFDMRLDRGVHWHGRHPDPLSNPTEHNVKRWCKACDGGKDKLRELGVQVINCSAESALQSYPKMTIEGALARWRL